MTAVLFSRTSALRLTAVCALSAAGLLSLSACGSNQAQAAAAAPVHAAAAGSLNQGSTAQGPAARNSTAQNSTAQRSTTQGGSGGQVTGGPGDSGGAGDPSATSPCSNGEVQATWGFGSQSQPQQASGIVLTNVGTATCTLQGYPGASIVVGSDTINAKRELNGFRGSLPPLSSPPLVTLAPGAKATSVILWDLHTNQQCYPSGTGKIEVTVPQTTLTQTLSSAAQIGTQGICSGLTITPVIPGTPFGT